MVSLANSSFETPGAHSVGCMNASRLLIFSYLVGVEGTRVEVSLERDGLSAHASGLVRLDCPVETDHFVVGLGQLSQNEMTILGKHDLAGEHESWSKLGEKMATRQAACLLAYHGHARHVSLPELVANTLGNDANVWQREFDKERVIESTSMRLEQLNKLDTNTNKLGQWMDGW